MAKAVINLKEGVIELEGPVEFVREYLKLYRPALRQSLGTAAETGAAQTQGVVPGRERVLGGRKAKGIRRPSCSKAIDAELRAGFFDKARAIQQVRKQLMEKGLSYTNNCIRMNLKKLINSGLLNKVGAGRATRYEHAG